MAQSIEENLLQAIKKDDIKAFDALMERTQCGVYRLGRFPVLSLLYLYKSRKILSTYEESFLKITNFESLREPIEVSKKFTEKAGKCLRLYLNEIVSPIEMLLILDRTTHLKKVFPLTKPSSSVKGRLKSIYYIKYSLSVRYVGDDIILDKRPFTYSEKKKIATACICLFLAITIAIVTPITTVSLLPKPDGGGDTDVEIPDVVKPDDSQNTDPIKIDVTQLSEINFASKNEYTLKADIVLPDNYSVSKVNCTIVGDGNKLILGKGVLLGEMNGQISDLTVESSGNTIFTSISENASIKNAVFNVNADVTATDGRAFVAMNNYGTIDGVTLNASGKINVISTSTVDTYGGIVLNNSYKFNAATQTVYNGVIKNCKANYSRFTLVGVAGANASFGGIVGANNAYLQDCLVSGEIVADTFDIAGICSVNNGLLSDNVNEANLSQTSTDTGWNPIVCGIVMTNSYAVENCENKGNITAVSNCEVEESEESKPTVSAAGIAYVNSSTIVNCINGGAIAAKGNYTSYVGGIAAHSYTQISNCLSNGEITVTAQKVYAGGILGISEVTNRGYYVYFGSVDSCISENKIDVSVIDNSSAYVGGIIGFVSEAGFGSEDDLVYFGGGATNCYFIGECVSDVTYFGNIVGVCGENIYKSNSYTSGNTEYHNFENNYYLQNSYKSIGSTVSGDGNFAQAESKGATRTTIEEIKNNENYQKILSALVVD